MSVPGPTWPNRLFLHAATSGGFADNNPRDYAMRTIFHNLADNGHSWKIYFHDIPQALGLSEVRRSVAQLGNLGRICRRGGYAAEQHCAVHSALPGDHRG